MLLNHLESKYGGPGGVAYESLDIKGVLKDMLSERAVSSAGERGAELQSRMDLLEADYTDTILVFDYDAQDTEFDGKRLEAFMRAFSDSTDVGALYLNYPMVESFCDFNQSDETSYLESSIRRDELNRYKTKVKDRPYRDVRRLTAPVVARIIALNASKIEHLSQGAAPDDLIAWNRSHSLSGACAELDLTGFLELQNHLLETSEAVYICNTCLLFLSAFPKRLDEVWEGVGEH